LAKCKTPPNPQRAAGWLLINTTLFFSLTAIFRLAYPFLAWDTQEIRPPG
jgi:hypothetical protein